MFQFLIYSARILPYYRVCNIITSTVKISAVPTFRNRLVSNCCQKNFSISTNLSAKKPVRPRPPKSTKPQIALNPDKLSKLLDVSTPSILALLLKKPSIRSANPEKVYGTGSVLNKYGIGTEELVQQYADIFLMTPNAVESYILIFKEAKFKDIRPHLILNYRELTKQSLDILKTAGYIPTEENVVQNYCKQLGMSENYEKQMWAELPPDYEYIPLCELRVFVLTYYLMSLFDCNLDSAKKMIATYPRFKNRSYQWVKANLKLLTEKLQFPLDKIRKHSYLLQTNPSNSLEIIENISYLGGRPIAEIIHLRPKIIMSTLSSLREITELFDQHEIPATAIAKYPEVFTLSPATIRSRLEEFQKTPEFGVLKNHPRVGRLIYYQNKIKKRLEYLQNTHQVYNTSLHILSTNTEHFEHFIKHGEMRTRANDNVHFVANYLNLPRPLVRSSLKVQPHWRDISSVTIHSVLNYLTKTKSFTTEQIKYGLPLVLYPLDKVMANVRYVEESKEAQETDLYFLQMVLYFIEKKNHFSGAGVWDNETNQIQNKNIERRAAESEQEEDKLIATADFIDEEVADVEHKIIDSSSIAKNVNVSGSTFQLDDGRSFEIVDEINDLDGGGDFDRDETSSEIDSDYDEEDGGDENDEDRIKREILTLDDIHLRF